MRFWKDVFFDEFKIRQKVGQKLAKVIFDGQGQFPWQLLGRSASRAVPVGALSRGARILGEFRHWVLHVRALASWGRRI